MKINNENKKYTLHFMFSYKYYTYQIFMDTCNGKQYQKTYQIMRTQETLYMTIHQEQYI